MEKGFLLTFAVTCLIPSIMCVSLASEEAFEYPCYLVDAYDADDSCWTGMDAEGRYQGPIRVVPGQWLIGPPMSEKSGITLPPDHWVEVQFQGPIQDGPDDDIMLIELGPVSEQARIFITDGAGREYLLDMATSGNVGTGVDPTEIGFDISNIVLPFEPRAVRILGIDEGGQANGFDVASVRARISTDCGNIACNPIPVDGAKNMPTDTILSWSTGQYAKQHNVYFGMDISAVNSIATDVSKPAQPKDVNSFNPGGLEMGKTYYWRVDEVNDPNVWPGRVWSFTTIDYLMVDDFESYNLLLPTDPNVNDVSDTWTHADVYLWMDDTHECSKKSMGFFYHYYHDTVYSEAVRIFEQAQDWTAFGAKALELYFYGQGYNIAAQMYIALSDGNGEIVVPYTGDANDVKRDVWQPWRIDLNDLKGINLGHIESMAIGFCREPGKPYSTGSGTVFFDDIRLYSSRCLELNRPDADFNGDCLVDLEDLEEMAFDWLDREHKVYPVAAPGAPIAWYKFDGNAVDSAGTAHGHHRGNPVYVPGIYGEAISFDGYEDSVEIIGAAHLFSKITTGITIAFWQYGASSQHHTDTLCCSNYDYGVDAPAIAINLGCWRKPGQYNWDCGWPWSFDGRLSGEHRYEAEWSGRWNHWAFAKDADAGTMKIFLNGLLYDSREGAHSPVSKIISFEIGSGWYGGYDGLIDDFRIYDYALSQPEIAHAATNGTGIFDQPPMSPADLNSDNQIDFRDFVLFSDHWLENQIWP